MANRFGGEALVPGIQAERATIEAQLYFGRIEQQRWNGGIIASTALDPGHTGQTSQLRPGLIMAQVRSTGKLVEWNPHSTTLGVNIISGFLNHHIDLTLDGVAQDRYTNLLMYGGNIKASEIIVPSSLLNNQGQFDGNEWEFEIREQLKHRFFFDDDIYGEITATKTLQETTTALTLADIDSNTIVSNANSAVNLALVLPDPKLGLHFTADQIGDATGRNITVTTAGAGTDFLDEGTDIGASSVITGVADFSRTRFDAVLYQNTTVDLYKYMVSRHSIS